MVIQIRSNIGDYITVVSEDAGANVAYSATFNGEEDIYYVRIRPAVPLTDFNSDARPDLLLFNASPRQTAVWYLNNNVRIGSASGPTLPGAGASRAWRILIATIIQIICLNTATRATWIWYMNDNLRIGNAFGPTLLAGWTVAALGDFNSDGYPVSAVQCEHRWNSCLVHAQQCAYRRSIRPDFPAALSVAGVADFNGDANPDYLLFNTNTHQTVIWYMSGVTRIGSRNGLTIPAGFEVAGLSDFDGNGKPDYLLYNSSTRQTAIWYLNNYQLIGTVSGPTCSLDGASSRRDAGFLLQSSNSPRGHIC